MCVIAAYVIASRMPKRNRLIKKDLFVASSGGKPPGGGFQPAASQSVETAYRTLEQETHPELNLPRSGDVVVVRRVQRIEGREEGQRRIGRGSSHGVHLRDLAGVVHVIEQVEGVGAELQPIALPDGESAGDAKVHVLGPWKAEGVALQEGYANRSLRPEDSRGSVTQARRQIGRAHV